jgi:hypothetical protein
MRTLLLCSCHLRVLCALCRERFRELNAYMRRGQRWLLWSYRPDLSIGWQT